MSDNVLPTLDGFLAAYAGERPITDVTIAADDYKNSPFVVVRCGKWAVVLNPQNTGGYLSVDVHSFMAGDGPAHESHPARVIGFNARGGAVRLDGGHDYPLTAVIVGED